MATRVLLTIDTELTGRAHADGASWRENYARSFDPAGVGVPWQLAILAEHGLKACFFVDPMPALLFGMEPVRQMIAPILAAGQEVQLHLHPSWTGAGRRDADAEDAEFELTAYDEAGQRALIARARDLLIEAGAPSPIAFRSGSYAANDATLRALSSLGFVYDSSHNGSEAPWPSAIGLPTTQVAPIVREGIVEVPVTVMEQAPGKLRHLQVAAVSLAELRGAVNHAVRADHPLVTIVSHSFELATRDGRQANAIVRRRFAGLCRLLAKRRDALPTSFFTDLSEIPVGRAARPMPPKMVRTAARMAEQAFANLAFERRL